MGIYMPPPRYQIAFIDRNVAITRLGRPIAHANRYSTLAPAECTALVKQANVSGELVTALKWLVAAITVAHDNGEKMPRPVMQARDRGLKALEAAAQ